MINRLAQYLFLICSQVRFGLARVKQRFAIHRFSASLNKGSKTAPPRAPPAFKRVEQPDDQRVRVTLQSAMAAFPIRQLADKEKLNPRCS